MQTLPSFIKDTKDFLRIVLDLPPLPENAILVTADVVSLYTNIPHKEGIEVFVKVLSAYSQLLPSDAPSLHTIRILLEEILTNNCFEFAGSFFQQIHGTAMGSKCAPPFASIFMGDFEISKILPLTVAIMLWKRFIDDVFFIFTGTEEELKSLFHTINEIHPTIKFTFEYSRTQVHYLDTNLFIGPNRKIYTTLYTKPTDTFALLHFDSYHPLSTKTSIIYSQALRYRMLTSRDDDLAIALQHLEWVLSNRGYPKNIINNQISKIKGISQRDLVFSQNNTTPCATPPNPTVIAIPHNPLNKNIMNIIHSNWHLVSEDPTLSGIFNQPPLLATKRNKNLKDILVHANTYITDRDPK